MMKIRPLFVLGIHEFEETHRSVKNFARQMKGRGVGRNLEFNIIKTGRGMRATEMRRI